MSQCGLVLRNCESVQGLGLHRNVDGREPPFLKDNDLINLRDGFNKEESWFRCVTEVTVC